VDFFSLFWKKTLLCQLSFDSGDVITAYKWRLDACRKGREEGRG
jgi:hypothetical protein